MSLKSEIGRVGLGSFERAPTQRLLPRRQPRHPEPTDNDPAMAAGEERDGGDQNQWVKAPPARVLAPARPQRRHPEPTDNDPAMAAGEERDVGYQNQWVKASRARVWARAPCSRRADRRGARVGFGAHRLPYLCER